MSKTKVARAEARHFKAPRRSPSDDVTRGMMRGNTDGISQTAIVDLTKLKRTEDKIRESRKRYRNLFDLVPVAVYTCDANGVI